MSNSDPAAPSASIFICYRRADSSYITDRIHDWLDREFPGAVFRDVDAIPFGADFRQYIRQVLDTCRIMLVVIGPEWLTVTSDSGGRRIDEPHDHVRIEIETALAHEDVLVIPLLVRDAKFPSPKDLPPTIEALAYRHGPSIRRDPDFKNDMGRLIRAIASQYAITPEPARSPTAEWPAPDKPWENGLGMRFVPVPGTQVLFSVWETRVRDFEAFVEETGYDATGGAYTLGADDWKQRGGSWKSPGFDQTGDHPVVCVSWEDAQAFCKWLTDKEREAGRMGTGEEYRLPTDHEWSCAVGIGDRENPDQTPEEKNEKIQDVYPWGKDWPPPTGAGNYAGSEAKTKDWPSDWETINGYWDGYARTSPVGSFNRNSSAIYDLGGNVWEWCEDTYNPSDTRRVLRGASWYGLVPDYLLSSYRYYVGPEGRLGNYGFRCVLVVESSR